MLFFINSYFCISINFFSHKKSHLKMHRYPENAFLFKILFFKLRKHRTDAVKHKFFICLNLFKICLRFV